MTAVSATAASAALRLYPELVAAMAGHPEAVTALAAEHVPDRLGRCAVCHHQQLGVSWPCAIAGVAGAALQLRAATYAGAIGLES